MPKMKTKKGAVKRFKVTGSGRFKHKQSHLRHILTKKNSKRRRQLRQKHLVEKSDMRSVARMLNME